MKRKITHLAVAGIFVCVQATSALGYGPAGHEIIGGIAAEKLAGTPTAAKVQALLDGIPLTFAATIPDRIRSWDAPGAIDADNSFKMPDHPGIDAQLRAFWRANQPTGHNDDAHPSHHWFHYTDVPVVGNETYAGGTAGRGRWDVVHMITYCSRVLSGQESEQNDRAITKPVALILLAHYVGDIHQPLHVGAEYFDDSHPANPDSDHGALPDEGGNTLTLVLIDAPGTDPNAPRRRPNLHGYWDFEAISLLTEQVDSEIRHDDPRHRAEVSQTEVVHRLAQENRRDWQLPVEVKLPQWSEAWADDILPIAREAHARLDFTALHVEADHGRREVSGVAMERPGENPPYANWSAAVARIEVEKAGNRLAAMLTAVLN